MIVNLKLSVFMILKLLLIFVFKFNDLKIAAYFCFQILIAVLYHCIFNYVLFFLPDETLEQGRNALR